jgi:hypothetical protein
MKDDTLRHAGAKGESECSSYTFLTSALDGESGQCHALPPGKNPGAQCIEYCVGLRAGLDRE